MVTHEVHKELGTWITEVFCGYEIIKDAACTDASCNRRQQVRLYRDLIKSKPENYCFVDMIIVKDNVIKVIIEIEESGFSPTKIYGKFLTSALCSYYHFQKRSIEINKHAAFIQIIAMGEIKKKSIKIMQYQNIEKSIRKILPIGRIQYYNLIYGDKSEFLTGTRKAEVIDIIKESI